MKYVNMFADDIYPFLHPGAVETVRGFLGLAKGSCSAKRVMGKLLNQFEE